MFSVVDAVLLKSLPYANAGRLVTINAIAPGSGFPGEFAPSSEFFLQYKEQSKLIEDIALYRDVLLGSAPQPLQEQAAPPRIGFCRTHLWPQLEPATQKLLEDAARRLARAGAAVEDVELPAEFERVEDAHRWISSFEFTRNLAWEIEYHWEKISETCRNGRIKDGLSCTYECYRDACAHAVRCRRLPGWSRRCT